MADLSNHIAGKTALVTGAAHRLGREVAEFLAEAGAHVVIHYRGSRKAAQDAAARIEEHGVRAYTIGADLSRRVEAEALLARATERAGPIDLLVNNAAVFPNDGFADFDWERLEEHLQINTWAPLTLIRAFAAQRRPGTVINLLDTRVTSYDPTHFSYGLSKHLLRTLTAQLALELAPSVRVNGVAPGLVLPPPGEDRAYLERRARVVPLQRHGEVRDIVRAVRFLLESPFITGQVIYVDGGAHLGAVHL